MAFDIATLTGWGIPADTAETIVAQHDEVVAALKEQVEEARQEYEKRKAETETDAEWKEKYESEKAAFDSFKAEYEARETDTRKREAYGRIMRNIGVPEKIISLAVRVVDTSALRLDKCGNLDNPEAITLDITREYEEFLPKKGGIKWKNGSIRN